MTLNLPRFVLRSLRHYWRNSAAVILGIVAATAVITGALIVGDSVRDSLRQMSLDRLGRIDHALVGQRFFTEGLAEALTNGAPDVADVAPAIAIRGSVSVRLPDGKGQVRRAGNVNLYGVDSRFWKLGNEDRPEFSFVANRRLAEQLQLKPGDDVSVVVEIPAAIPRDALLGERDETSTELLQEVTAIAEDDSMAGRFGLNPTQQLPLNAFVPLETLQRQMGLAQVRPTRRNPESRSARINALFVATKDGQLSQPTADALTTVAARKATLDDLGLKVKPHPDHGYVSIESERMILEDSLSQRALSLFAPERTSASLIYLVNEIHNAADPAKYGMYSVAAGIDFATHPPFGPFRYVAGGPPSPDETDGIVLNKWASQDLGVQVGDRIDAAYYVVGDRGELPETQTKFVVRGIAALDGAALDRGYAPDVPGVTDAETYGDWREPFPLKRDRITPRDDDYWEQYRTTPKLFLPLKAAQSLWKSRYGQYTTIRIAPAENQNLQDLATEAGTKLLAALTPDDTGLRFLPVKEHGLLASEKSGDFTGLFIGFSFFLIVAASLLIGLLFRLGIERRIREFGLLSAVGWPPSRVRNAFLLEGTFLVLFGIVLGSAAGVAYAEAMMYGLRTWWIGAVGTRFLFLSVHPGTLAIGAALSAIVSLLAILWGLRQPRRYTTREQLSGASEATEGTRPGGGGWSRWIAAAGLGVAGLLLVASLIGLVPQTEAFGGFSWQIVAFFVTGIAALTGSQAAFAAWLASDRSVSVRGHGAAATTRLSLRNASRHRSRSLLTASLLASAVFVVVAVAAGRRNPAVEKPDPHSGNGGFTLVAQTSSPLLYDLNTPAGRAKLGLNPNNDPAVDALAAEMRVASFRTKPGEDASCLNIYRTSVPTILGLPETTLEEFSKSKRFKFADTPSSDPWPLLLKPAVHGGIPVFGDMNTLMYSLHKGIGDSIEARDANGSPVTLEVVGMLDASVLQGVLVMSEANFLRLYPDSGFRDFLIECPVEKADEVSTLLESRLGDSGFDAERVAVRLADFLAVQNTYLSTFQSLGGLGLLLGTLGLATVMLRNVLERRGELALMRAIGIGNRRVGAMVLVENLFLVVMGTLSGAGAALLSMGPHLRTAGADVPWGSLMMLISGVIAIGAIAALGAVWNAVRSPIVSTLRGE